MVTRFLFTWYLQLCQCLRESWQLYPMRLLEQSKLQRCLQSHNTTSMNVVLSSDLLTEMCSRAYAYHRRTAELTPRRSWWDGVCLWMTYHGNTTFDLLKSWSLMISLILSHATPPQCLFVDENEMKYLIALTVLDYAPLHNERARCCKSGCIQLISKTKGAQELLRAF